MDVDPELQLGDWQPHRPEDFAPWQRLTIELLNSFDAALMTGQIPTRCYRGSGPDYEANQVEIVIFPDDDSFRKAVAAVLPSGSYRIEVSDLRHMAT